MMNSHANHGDSISLVERLSQVLVGTEIDQYVHRELSHFGAMKIVEAIMPYIEALDAQKLYDYEAPPKQLAKPRNSHFRDDRLRDELTIWSVTNVPGETHATKVDRILPLLGKYTEEAWEAGYDKAEDDAEGTGFWATGRRANPHSGVMPK